MGHPGVTITNPDVLAFIAMALAGWAREYDGAAPQYEIDLANHLAETFEGMVKEWKKKEEE